MSDAAKQAAALDAALLVQDGMRLGLGSGTTMHFVVRAIAERLRAERLTVRAVATSTDIEALAAECGIAVEPPDAPLDLAIDGADEVETARFWLIKGRGGALLREKIVAESSRRFVIVADPSKLVECLGLRAPLPIEVARFGQASTTRRLAEMGGKPVLRLAADGAPFVTDGGNCILDCAGFAPIGDPVTLERRLRAVAGVVGTGLFLLPVEQVVVGADDGSVSVLRHPAHAA